jgi:F-type H+-transporting ATPase subunit a
MFSNTVVDTVTAFGDTLVAGGGKDDSGWIMHHITDSRVLEFHPFGEIHLPQLPLIMGIDITPTKHVLFMWLTALMLIVLFGFIAGRYKKTLIPKGIVNFFEVFIVFVRDEIAKTELGHNYHKFMPYLLTVFFFILFGNFLGLIPYSATFTSNIAVTATLAAFTFLCNTAWRYRELMDLGGYLKGLVPHGIPSWMLVIMIPVELLGLFTKPFALAIRLFANMVAGHTVILALIGLIFFMQTIFVAFISIPFTLFVYMLEILVALIQAYIFTMLSSLFIGMAVHQEH